MIPILYDSIVEGQIPNHFGLGSLTDTISAKCTEERNGAYEIVLEYPSSGIHAEDIAPNRFIMAKPNFTDAPQIFRIYKIGKDMGGKFQVFGQHISYDLSGKVVPSGVTGGSATAAVLALKNNGGGDFNITTDIVSSRTFRVDVPSSTRSWFGGKEGSLLDIYGGEWKYDNYTCSLLASRGTNRGVQIRYGKNLTQLSQELDMSSLVTGVYGYAVNPNTNAVTTGSKISTGLALDVPHDIAIDFSNDIDWESSTAIATQLNTLATNYVSNNSASLINIRNSITLDFVQMKDLTDRVDLCDTVSIFFEALGISASVKCIKTEWDVLEERYTRTSFGDARTNITDTISSQTKKLEVVPTSSEMASAVKRATELITGNLGGYVILHDADGDGKPDEILIMNTEDPSTSTEVWRWNKNGLAYGNSYEGPFNKLALTSDGQIVATAITSGVLNADLIKAGTISDTQGNSTIDMTSGVAKMKNFDAITRIRLLNSSDVVKWQLVHNIGSGVNMTFYNESGTDCGGFSSASGGGIFTINDGDGNRRCRINSDGVVYLYNQYNNAHTYLFANSSGQGEVYIGDGSTTNVYLHGGSGNITCVSLTQTSSRKTKENIKTIADSEKILDLQAVSFDFKNKNHGTNKRGFIAEDVAEVLPNLVADGETPSLNYVEMIPYLQDVIKKQEARIKALEEKLYGSN